MATAQEHRHHHRPGTAGYVLAYLNGVPTWVATTTLANISGTLAVTSGGTGQTSFGQAGSPRTAQLLSASTSPTVNYITATSTTATSTFAAGVNLLPSIKPAPPLPPSRKVSISPAGCFSVNGTCVGAAVRRSGPPPAPTSITTPAMSASAPPLLRKTLGGRGNRRRVLYRHHHWHINLRWRSFIHPPFHHRNLHILRS